MTIDNKWVIREACHDPESGNPECFFCGMVDNPEMHKQSAAFRPISSQTKRYKSQRAALSAICRIRESGYEGFPEPEYIEHADVPDIAEKPAVSACVKEYDDCLKCPYFLNSRPLAQGSESPDSAPLSRVEKADSGGWEIIEAVGGKLPPLMLRKKWTGTYSYAIQMGDGSRYYLPGDEICAWERYYDECKHFMRQRIQNRQ